MAEARDRATSAAKGKTQAKSETQSESEVSETHERYRSRRQSTARAEEAETGISRIGISAAFR